MSSREQLHGYITRLEKRLRWSVVLRGVAIFTGGALIATVLLVAVANARAFSSGSVTGARLALILILAAIAAVGLAIPIRRLTRRRTIEKAETAFPQFEQRLTTFTEKDGHDPFIELLADDTLSVARSAQPEEMISENRLWFSLAAGVGACAVLVWMIAAGPGFLGYGASLLWTGPHRDKPAIYDLRVTPGDAAVRRHSDEVISALPVGLKSPDVKLYAKYQSSSKWEAIAMHPAIGSFAGGYQFMFGGLPENVEYYVTAGAMTSKHYTIKVTDLPSVKQIRVTYHYPAWTGLPNETEERGGDLRAVTGTIADLEISTDRPLPSGKIQLDNGQVVQLAGGTNNVYRGSVKMDSDGAYHVTGIEEGQSVRVSEDFFIEARKADPPQISLVRPGRGDYHASPIEEVTIAAKANDEYPLKDMELHYSVNGGAEKTIDILKQKGAKEADGSTTVSLEDFKLVPGDLVSVYATAKDANAEAHTDMVFVQADPFERDYSQSQQSGGGGGGGGGGQGNSSEQITQREKDIIAATFRQQSDKTATAQQAADVAKLLSETQNTLHDQAVKLSNRLQARELTDEMQAISEFEKDMMTASDAMQPAVQQLKQEKWKDAVPNEQKALQALLRADATFRQIQVSFGQRGGGGGGGGGGGQAARDLAALFDLEMDTNMNQYETRQSSTGQVSEEQKQQAVDDAMKKLADLAHRQEDLAQQQRNGVQTAEQKWQQEMLRREAEQVQQQMEQQMAQQQQQSGQQGQQGQQAQNGQQGQQGQQSASAAQPRQASQGGGQAGQSGQSGQAGQSSGQGQDEGVRSQQSADASAVNRQQAEQQTLDRLRQANDDMRRAAASGNAADARRAADRLREATDALGQSQKQDAGSRIGAMAQEASQLANAQKQQADHVRDLLSQMNAARQAGKNPQFPSAQEVDKMVNDRQQVTEDLQHLTQQVRDTTREIASTQPNATEKLRGALDTMDENDLNTRMQRSSDMLRSGNFSDPSETSLTNDLQKLNQQLSDAARAMGQAQTANTQDAQLNQAMDSLSRLRDQVGGLGGRPGSQQGQRQGQGQRQQQSGTLSRQGQGQGQQGQGGQGQGQGQGGQQQAQNGQGGQGGQQGGQGGGRQAGMGNQNGAGGQNGGNPQGVGNRQAGPVGNAGGNQGQRGNFGGWNTGNTHIQGQAATPSQGPTPADTQKEIDQEVGVLNQVKTAVQDSPEARAQVQALIQQMRSLDPSRFQSNPQQLDQMHQQLTAEVEALELQVRKKLDESQGGTIRNTDPSRVPAGYQDSVAEYYRKLSAATH